jgi:hypothetical protein
MVGFYACSVWLTPEPSKTAGECSRALAYLQYHEGHHDEYWAELERGGRIVKLSSIGRNRDKAASAVILP